MPLLKSSFELKIANQIAFHYIFINEDGEAKFWLEPIISLAVSHGLNPRKLNEIQKIVDGHKDEIIKAWQRHFSKR